jgi:hypothetical protein
VADNRPVSAASQPFGSNPSEPTPSQPAATNPAPQPAQQPAASPQNQQEATDQTEPTRQRERAPSFPPYNGGGLPAAGAGPGLDLGDGRQPVIPPGPVGGGVATVPDGSGKSQQPQKSPNQDPPPDVDQRPRQDPAPQEDPGTIEINVHNGGGKSLPGGSQTVGGSSAGLGSNGVEALARTGNLQFQSGSFGAAATSYERALRGGGDPIRLNQMLGRIYERLGRTSDAVSAYDRAVSACKTALDSGKGDRSRIQATMDTCEQASKTLGG